MTARVERRQRLMPQGRDRVVAQSGHDERPVLYGLDEIPADVNGDADAISLMVSTALTDTPGEVDAHAVAAIAAFRRVSQRHFGGRDIVSIAVQAFPGGPGAEAVDVFRMTAISSTPIFEAAITGVVELMRELAPDAQPVNPRLEV